MRDPLLAPLAAIATGIVVSRLVPFDIRELLAVIAAFAILGLISLYRHTRVLAVLSCLLALLFAGALVDVVHRPGPPPRLDAEGPVVLEGCVVEPPVLSGDRARFVLELEPRARVQVTLYQPEKLAYGQRIELDARVRRPHNFANPGAFDYARNLARKHIYWTASTSPGRPIRHLGSCGSGWMRAVMSLRTTALDRLAQLYHNRPYETGMMQAILIGESFQLERVWTEQFRSTGTFHAIVISGTHVAVLAAFLLLLLRICFVPRQIALLLTVLAAWLYAIVTGWQPPCVRAAAGMTLFLIGLSFYRERRILNLLAAVAIAFLLFDPEQMFEASFQLSFLAVGFIGAFAAPLLERTWLPLRDLEDTGYDIHLPPRAAQLRVELRLLAETVRLAMRLPERACMLMIAIPARAVTYIWQVIVVSAVVQMGLALPMVIYFHRIGFSGLSANALIVPIFEFLIPLGFIAVFTGWIWAAKLAGLLLAASRVVVQWHASVEPNWRIPTPPLWLSMALTLGFVAVAVLPRRGNRSRTVAARLAVALVAILLVLLVWHPFPPRVAPKQLELTVIDVGQGDSLLVAFPNGKLLVMDGGGIPSFGGRSRAQLDIGEDVVAPYLWQRSIRTIDILVLSHAHEDHIGGLPALLEDFHVKELWTGATPDCPQWNALRGKALRRGVKIAPLTHRQQFELGGVQVRALAPPPGYVPADKPHNNDSLALRLAFGEHVFLLSGDVERQVESSFLDVVGKTDVLKVAHHGSRTSSSPAFLDLARPAFAVISAGLENSYGHPHPDVLKRLTERHAFVLRTDRDGLVTLRSDGHRIHVESARSSALPLFF